MAARAGNRPRLIAEKLGFTEGPLWTREGRLLVASISRGLLYAVDEAGGAAAVAEPGGNPNGLAQDHAGTVWVAQAGGHTRTSSERPTKAGVQAIGTDGTLRDVVTSGTTAPNDCAVAPDGRLWFTDPVAPAFEAEGPPGRLCALDPKQGALEVVAGGLRYPNGLAFSIDGTVLFLAETGTARILRFDVVTAAVSAPLVHADLGGAHPDGLALDCEGRLYVASPTRDVVLVLDRSGRVVDDIPMPAGSFPTNLCFGGAGHERLFITCASGGRVFAVDGTTPGAPLPGSP